MSETYQKQQGGEEEVTSVSHHNNIIKPFLLPLSMPIGFTRIVTLTSNVITIYRDSSVYFIKIFLYIMYYILLLENFHCVLIFLGTCYKKRCYIAGWYK